MSSAQDIIVAFDLYGTLLSTESISKKLAEFYGQDKAVQLALEFRKYQLEYTWRLNSMGVYMPFSEVTENSLRHTLIESGVNFDNSQVSAIMAAYDSLSTFPDVEQALKDLASTKGISCVVFSNGTSTMVGNSVKKSPDLSPHANLFKDLIVVESTKHFKPHPEVYKYLAQKCGKDGNSKESMASMWLISGNPFDVVGARTTGMNAAWVDRSGNGWTDCLLAGDVGKPTGIVKGLHEVADLVKKHAGR